MNANNRVVGWVERVSRIIQAAPKGLISPLLAIVCVGAGALTMALMLQAVFMLRGPWAGAQ